MHYSNLVIIDKMGLGLVEAHVKLALGPSAEDGGFWDWYQIGGRWHGVFTEPNPNYDRYAVKDGYIDPRDVIDVESLTEEHLQNFHRVVCLTEDWGRSVWGGEYFKTWLADDPEFRQGRVKHGEVFQKLEKPPLAWLKKQFKGCIAVVVDNHA